jgi:N utilization substance protein B
MAKRRRARKIVLDILYRMEIERSQVEDMIETYRNELEEKGIADFANKLLKGVIEHRQRIDELIDQYADRWSVERMPVLDRNILRIGIYEILHEPDIPYSVSINEAVELANTYSTEESGKFVNGILGRVVKEIESKDEPLRGKKDG